MRSLELRELYTINFITIFLLVVIVKIFVINLIIKKISKKSELDIIQKLFSLLISLIIYAILITISIDIIYKMKVYIKLPYASDFERSIKKEFDYVDDIKMVADYGRFFIYIDTDKITYNDSKCLLINTINYIDSIDNELKKDSPRYYYANIKIRSEIEYFYKSKRNTRLEFETWEQHNPGFIHLRDDDFKHLECEELHFE